VAWRHSFFIHWTHDGRSIAPFVLDSPTPVPKKQAVITTHSEGSCEALFLPPFVCMSVFLPDIRKTNAARSTKLDAEMFHE